MRKLMVALICCLALSGGVVARAQGGPTRTPTPTATGIPRNGPNAAECEPYCVPTATVTPYRSPTPSFTLFGIPIILPTAGWKPLPTNIPILYTPAPNLNPLGLKITMYDVPYETINMKKAIEDVMGPTGNILGAIVNLSLHLGVAVALYRVIRRGRRMAISVYHAFDNSVGWRVGLIGNPGRNESGTQDGN